MKRVDFDPNGGAINKTGANQGSNISWDGLDLVASEIKRAKTVHGPVLIPWFPPHLGQHRLL